MTDVRVDRAIISELMLKHGRSYFYMNRALKRLGWCKKRIIDRTDFLFKEV